MNCLCSSIMFQFMFLSTIWIYQERCTI